VGWAEGAVWAVRVVVVDVPGQDSFTVAWAAGGQGREGHGQERWGSGCSPWRPSPSTRTGRAEAGSRTHLHGRHGTVCARAGGGRVGRSRVVSDFAVGLAAASGRQA
jgi:hypothetical protein